ncbi:MAG: alpha/beta hydrolase [Deltaproteobacteria bacterium]|nr:alpha/beta hydrolase [Deltaproteobacteria bacterium]
MGPAFTPLFRSVPLALALSAVLPSLPALAAGPRHAAADERPDECSRVTREYPLWTEESGCIDAPWNASDPAAGTFPLYYELSRPKGPSIADLIVFHGGPGYPRRHLQRGGELWESLRAHCTILYFHQRGSGFSARVADASALAGREGLFTLDRIVDDTWLLHQELLGGHPAVLVGKSAGGFLAMKFALAHPESTRSLVLAATSPHHGYISRRNAVKTGFFLSLDERWPGFLAALGRARAYLDRADADDIGPLAALPVREDLLESMFFDLAYTLDGQFEMVAMARDLAERRFGLFLARAAAGKETLRPTGLESDAVLNLITCRELRFADANPLACSNQSEGELYDLRDRLHELSVPVLVLSGRYDPILPPPFQEEIVRNLPGMPEWHVLELSSHMLFEEQPKACTVYILDFLGIPRQQLPQSPGL